MNCAGPVRHGFFFLGVVSKSHQAFIYSCPPQSPQDGIEGDLPQYTERLSEALAVPRTCTRQGCRSPHVLMGGWVEHPGLAGRGAGLKWRKVPRGQGWRSAGSLCREPHFPCPSSVAGAAAGLRPVVYLQAHGAAVLSPQDAVAASTHTRCMLLTQGTWLEDVSIPGPGLPCSCCGLSLPGPPLRRFCPLKIPTVL